MVRIKDPLKCESHWRKSQMMRNVYKVSHHLQPLKIKCSVYSDGSKASTFVWKMISPRSKDGIYCNRSRANFCYLKIEWNFHWKMHIRIMQQWIIKKGSWILFTYQSHGFNGILTFLGYDFTSQILSSENTKDSKVMKLTWRKNRFSHPVLSKVFIYLRIAFCNNFFVYFGRISVHYSGLFITVLVSTLLKNQ